MTRYKCKHCGFTTTNQYTIKNHSCENQHKNTVTDSSDYSISTTTYSDYSYTSSYDSSSNDSSGSSWGGGDCSGSGSSSDW